MLLKGKNFRFYWIFLLASIITTVLFDNGLSALEQSPNSTVTIKLKVLSESMNASDINEIRKLIEAGADVNKADNIHSSTPLFRASSKGHTEVVKLLKKYGANE